MRIIISNVLIVENPTKSVKDFIKKELTFINPEFAKLQKMGHWTRGTSRYIYMYQEEDGVIYTPIGFFSKLYKFHNVNSDYLDMSTTKTVNITNNLQLRKYQEPIPKIVEEQYTGLVLAPCGLGKTMMGLGIFGRLKQKCLWLCHNQDLLNQAKERAENFINCRTSTITEGKMDISGDIVFATIQTVIKYIEKKGIRQDEFGLIISDEVHRVSSSPKSFQMYRRCIEWFSARYRVGLTATKFRTDGLENCLNIILGEDIYHIDQEKDNYVAYYLDKELMRFPVSDFQVPANIKIINTEYTTDNKDIFDRNGGTIVFANLINDIAGDKKRNKLIISDLKKIKGSTVILSDRVEQLKYLCKNVENGYQIDGSTPKKIRTKVLNDVREGKIKYLFASYSLCKEGLDCPILENLVMATPVKTFSTVVQSIGRIQRIYEGKTMATVYDYVDDVGMLLKFFDKRRKVYRDNGWYIDNVYAKR